jgi:peptidoglycan/xylan/chitin deacetylase (PgdA/CDA1 family)
MRLSRWIKKAKVFLGIRKRTIVLMYHRVDRNAIDPWNLTVSPENFEGHLQFLKKTGLVKSLDGMKKDFLTGNKLKPAVVITFDDGYVDNYLNAKPLLEKYNLPATFFISNKHIGTDKEFWWDELAHMVFETTTLPKLIPIEIQGRKFSFDLGEEYMLTDGLKQKNILWNGLLVPSTKRADLYFQLWQALSPMRYEDQQEIMGKLRDCFGLSPHLNEANYCMSESQLFSLASNDLFTIGGHTYSHPLLPAHPYDIQYEEIKANKEYLENLTKKRIDSFAYPSGKSNDDTVLALKSSGFDMAFNTVRRRVDKEDDIFQIGRVQVKDWQKKEFEKRLGNMFAQ